MDLKVTDTDPRPLLEPTVEIGREAAARILEVYNSDFAVTSKEDRSPLTAADMAAHKTICAGLADLTPSVPVLSEESANVPYAERARWAEYWLVDPLDGTREFVKKNGEFTVNIALVRGHRPVLGVVVVPVRNCAYFACRGHGAFRQDGGGLAQSIATRKTDLRKLTAVGSRSHGSELTERFLGNLGKNVEILHIGSALKFCLVAEGRADVYLRLGPTSEWDTAAAQCLVEEAGGRVTELNLEPLTCNRKESLLNPSFLVAGDRDFDWGPYLPQAAL
ncbi:MAG TPA: 3'(2'),5'-bisphosphate nucleotidase CysQ [Gammaproteobacteria bacterium]